MPSYHFTSTCKNKHSHVYLPSSHDKRHHLHAKHAVPRKPRFERASRATRGSPRMEKGQKTRERLQHGPTPAFSVLCSTWKRAAPSFVPLPLESAKKERHYPTPHTSAKYFSSPRRTFDRARCSKTR